jgi:hypothetical protein
MSQPAAGTPPLSQVARLGGPGSKRVAWGSAAVSVALHALLLFGAALGLSLPPPSSSAVARAIAPAEKDVEIVWIIGGSPPPAVARPEEPEAIPSGGTPQVIVVRPSLSESGFDLDLPPLSGPGRPGETPAERLRPGLSDARLWAPLPEEFRTLTLEQREELLIAGRLGAWNDSVAAAAAAEAAWRDWTFTDGSGNRWGVADGQLHLGGLTIPFPMTFSGSAADREYMREFSELQRQGANALIQQSVRERQEAIRARRDRERAEAQARADSAGTVPR